MFSSHDNEGLVRILSYILVSGNASTRTHARQKMTIPTRLRDLLTM